MLLLAATTARRHINQVNPNSTHLHKETQSIPTYFGLDESSFWLIFFFISVILLLVTIGLVLAFECCCCRCAYQRKARELHVYDGGPIPTPDHLSTYEVTIVAEECSPTFRKSAIKFDLLDIHYRYITSFVIPSSALKFRIMSKIIELNQLEFAQMKIATKLASIRFEPMPETNELWINTHPASTVKFRLIRRNAIQNCAHVRISHDCFLPMATVSFKSLTLVDDRTSLKYHVDLSGKSISALHPCPPSGINLFQFEMNSHHER